MHDRSDTRRQTLTWWYVLLKQHGEQILRTCGGLKLLGSQIDSDDHAINPSSAQVNFIVPTASALRKLKPTKLDVSHPRKPGVFHDVLDNMNTDPTVCYNLQFDGKLLKQGLTQHGGDILTVWVKKTHIHYKNNNACIKFICVCVYICISVPFVCEVDLENKYSILFYGAAGSHQSYSGSSIHAVHLDR